MKTEKEEQKDYHLYKPEEYLDEEFPKGKSKLRGKALVLHALSLLEGKKQRSEEIKKIIISSTRSYSVRNLHTMVNISWYEIDKDLLEQINKLEVIEEETNNDN